MQNDKPTGDVDRLIGGVDEVGTGALAGPVVSCCVVYRESQLASLPDQITDSKAISEDVREAMFPIIMATAVDIGIGWCPAWESDSIGVFNALQLSYQRAIEDLTFKPDHIIMDGCHPIKSWYGSQQVEPQADAKYKPVSAASIYAKVTRDRMMKEYAKAFPQYGWENNKGYGTRQHEDGILRFGLLMDPNNHERYLHKRSHCKRFLYDQELFNTSPSPAVPR